VSRKSSVQALEDRAIAKPEGAPARLFDHRAALRHCPRCRLDGVAEMIGNVQARHRQFDQASVEARLAIWRRKLATRCSELSQPRTIMRSWACPKLLAARCRRAGGHAFFFTSRKGEMTLPF
jgi:hypothetical protein